MATVTVSHVEFVLAEMRSKYEQGRGQLALLQAQAEEAEQQLAAVQSDLDTWRQVQVLFARVSEYAREQLKSRIEQLVTAALQAVTGNESVSFHIELGERGGQPTADWQVVSCYGDEIIANSPEDARGGGITDIISLALRLALLELVRPKPAGPVILDEPGKHLWVHYTPHLAAFLQEYARKTGRQVLMVTHCDALADAADKSYHVTQTDGESEVQVQ